MNTVSEKKLIMNGLGEMQNTLGGFYTNRGRTGVKFESIL